MSTMNTLDLIDAIANRELVPVRHGGNGGVATVIAQGSDLEGLPKPGMLVEPLHDGYLVSWPRHPWNAVVQEYVDLVFDESGVADATE